MCDGSDHKWSSSGSDLSPTKVYISTDLKSRLKCPDTRSLLLNSLLWLQSSEVAASDTKTLSGARQTGMRRASRQWPTLRGNGQNCPSPAWKTCHARNECGAFHSMSQMRGWKLGYANMSEPHCLLCDCRHFKWRWESQRWPNGREHLERRIGGALIAFSARAIKQPIPCSEWRMPVPRSGTGRATSQACTLGPRSSPDFKRGWNKRGISLQSTCHLIVSSLCHNGLCVSPVFTEAPQSLDKPQPKINPVQLLTYATVTPL